MKLTDALDESYPIVHPDHREYTYRCKFCGHKNKLGIAGGPTKDCCEELTDAIKHRNRGVVNDFYDILVP